MPAYPRSLGTIIAATAMPAMRSPRSHRRSYVRDQARIGRRRAETASQLGVSGSSDHPGESTSPTADRGQDARSDVRWTASARSLSARRCASTRLPSDPRPSRTSSPVQRSNGSNVAEWITRVPPDTDSSCQLHSLSKPDPLTRSRKRASGRASRLSTRASSRRRPSLGAGGAGRRGCRPARGGRPEPELRVDRGAPGGVVQGGPHDPGRGLDEDPSLDEAVRAAVVTGSPVPNLRIRSEGHRPRPRSGARPSSSRGRRRSTRGVRRRGRRASRSGPRSTVVGRRRMRLMSSAASELGVQAQLVGDAPRVERVDVDVRRRAPARAPS